MDKKKQRALSFLSIRDKKKSLSGNDGYTSPLFKEPSPINNQEETSGSPEYSEDFLNYNEKLGTFSGDENGSANLPAAVTNSTGSGYEGEDDEFDFFKYVGVILVRKYWLLATVLIVVAGSYLLNRNAPKFYTSQARLVVKPHPVENAINNFGPNMLGNRELIVANHIENLTIPDTAFLSEVQDLLDTELTLREIEKSYSISLGRQSKNILIISVTVPSEKVSNQLADKLAQAYVEYDLSFRQSNFLERENWIRTQLKNRKMALNDYENKLTKFHQEHPKFTEESSANAVVKIEKDLNSLDLALEEYEHRISLAKYAYSKSDSVILAEVTQDNPLQKELLNLEVELARLRVDHGDESRKVKNMVKHMSNLKNLIHSNVEDKSYTTVLQTNPRYHELQNEIQDLEANRSIILIKKEKLEKVLEKAYRESAAHPELSLTYKRMQREKAASEKVYSMLSEKLEETRLQKSGVSREIFQIGRASRPKVTIQGYTKLSSSIIIGIIFGIIVCFIVEQLDRTIRFPSDIEKKYGIPVLGIIPEMEIESGKIDLDSDSKILEPYRNLRTNLNYSTLGHGGCRTIIMTSALQGEGKSTKAVNLAICFSLDGRKILLVDADLRRPSVHSLLGQERGPGLAEFLTGQNSFEQILKRTKYHGLITVGAGNKMPNPAEILGSPRMELFLKEASKAFDVVFFDSPAIFPVSDALVLAPRMQGALVVFRSNYTPLRAGEEVLRKLRQVGTTIIGGVLNDVHSGKGGYYYSYYGYYGYSYYHNYYEETHTNTKHPWLHAVKKDIGRQFTDMKIGFKNLFLWKKQGFNWNLWINWSLLFVSILILANFGFNWYLSKNAQPTFIPLDNQEKLPFVPQKPLLNDSSVKTSEMEENSSSVDSLLIYNQIQKWAQGLGKLNLPLYLSTYSVVQFSSKAGGFSEWKARKTREFKRIKKINLKLDDIKIVVIDSITAETNFIQTMTFDGNKRHYIKKQFWNKEKEGWLINREGIQIIEKELGVSDYVR